MQKENLQSLHQHAAKLCLTKMLRAYPKTCPTWREICCDCTHHGDTSVRKYCNKCLKHLTHRNINAWPRNCTSSPLYATHASRASRKLNHILAITNNQHQKPHDRCNAYAQTPRVEAISQPSADIGMHIFRHASTPDFLGSGWSHP